MIGAATLRSNPTVQIPVDNPTADIPSPFSTLSGFNNNADYVHYLTALHRYLPSNESLLLSDSARLTSDEESDSFACDEFRMYEFKVKRCPRGRSHDWTECPYAHPGEKARRRDPRRYQYCGVPCPEFRKGGCKKGDLCEFAHGVFECWLHPSRYRTQPCKDGLNCPRRVCFFAHRPDQLRTIPAHQNSYPTNTQQHFVSSPTSILASPSLSSPPESPPSSPQVGEFMDLVASMRQMNMGSTSSSPRVRSVFSQWGLGVVSEEEPVMERVESGRDLRARMYAKLSKENSFDRVELDPDVEWVSKLIN